MFTLRLLKIKIHSRRVFVFKRSLPVFAFLLASLMIAWPNFVKQKEHFSIPVLKDKSKSYDADMEHVRFFSKDSRKNPLTVTASSVQETNPAQKIMKLNEPHLTYRLSKTVTLTADTAYGLAFQNDEYLYLEKQVDAILDSGYESVAQKVTCDYKDGSMHSNAPVFIKGIGGMLSANGFKVSNKGAFIDFKGQTKTLIFDKEVALKDINLLNIDKIAVYYKNNQKNMYVTSKNGMKINQIDKTFTFNKDVIVQQNNNTLKAQNLVLNYEKDNHNKNKVTKMIATTDVFFDAVNQDAAADKLFYLTHEADMLAQISLIQQQDEFKSLVMPHQLIVLDKNAHVIDKSGDIYADKIFILYKNEKTIDKVYLIGHVKAKNKTQTILGDKGVYNPATETIELYQNVTLIDNNNRLTSPKASLNLKTGISQLLSGGKNKKTRVKGSLIPNELKQ